MKRLISSKEEENVLYMYGQLLYALESTCDHKDGSPLDRHLVTSGYRLLNRVQPNSGVPKWEERKAKEAIIGNLNKANSHRPECRCDECKTFDSPS